MEKIFRNLKYGFIGVAGGTAGLTTITGMCQGAGCAACFRCAGMGAILVAMALLNQKKGEEHELLKDSN